MGAMNLPNVLTSMRILLVPAVVYLMVRGSFAAAMWLFLAAGLSDVLDGFIAKRFDLCTTLGAVLDPLADKFLIASSVVVLACLGYLPWWLAVTIFVRDVVIVGGAITFYHRYRRLEMSPSLPSKLNTFAQILLVFLMLAQLSRTLQVDPWLPVLFGAAFLTALISGVHYVVVWGRKAGGLACVTLTD